jgi:hypothetical protein
MFPPFGMLFGSIAINGGLSRNLFQKYGLPFFWVPSLSGGESLKHPFLSAYETGRGVWPSWQKNNEPRGLKSGRNNHPKSGAIFVEHFTVKH